ncbi:MAG: hypothetical protein CMJ78_01625, partial [Planctomycetaceae bacterium]|nr:hypothetical protein [Planctomycetaceae bacterium]
MGSYTELLEQRQLLTLLTTFDNGVLTVSSDDGDNIVLATNENGAVTLNGAVVSHDSQPVNPTDVTSLNVFGDDAVNLIDTTGIRAASFPIAIDGGSGEDSIRVGSMSAADDGTGDTLDVSSTLGGIQVVVNSTDTITILDATAQLTIVGSTDQDSFSFNINFFGIPIPTGGLSFDGQDSGTSADSLDLRAPGFFTAATVTHQTTFSQTGSISIDDAIVSYTQVAQIDDRLTAVDREFNAFGGSDILVLSDDGEENDG